MSDGPRSLRAELVRAAVQAKLFGEAKALMLGRYELREHVGTGAMGSVFLARDADLERDVAVKVIRAQGEMEREGERVRRRLLREARAMAKLRHPNVVAVYEAGVVDDQAYIAMEYVQGTTLRAWLEEEPRSWQQVLEVFRQAAEGLAAAHEAGVVHRDFKPDNALVGVGERVQVTDFGVAHAFEAEEEAASLADDGGESAPVAARATDLSRAGTPRYMAPEQFDGADVDGRTDQFAFCVALFEALYGVPPFEGDTVAELAEAARAQTLRSPSDRRGVPRQIERALARGMRADQAERFESMAALLAALEPPRASRWPLWIAAVAALAAAAAIVALTGDAPAPQAAAPATTVTTTVVVTDSAAVDMAAALAGAAIERAGQAVGRVQTSGSATTATQRCSADSPACQLYGRCTKSETGCVAASDAACRAAEVCRLAGACSAQTGACIAASDDDCAAARSCERDGACSAREGRCRRDEPDAGAEGRD